MKKLFGFTLAAAAVAVSTGAMAQADVKWPTKPVQVIVPAGAGGDTDFNARQMARYFEKIAGKPMVVTNVNGGGGTISGLTINVNSSGGSVARAVFIADGVTGVNILNNSITATQGGNVQAQAIAFGNNTSGTLRGNTVTATGTGSASGTRALVATNTTTITAANNSFSASGAASAANDVLVLSGAGATFTAGSTGNTRGNGLCSGTSASGAVSFTNGTSCP